MILKEENIVIIIRDINIGNNQKYKIGELNYLENYLNTLLKERAQLENNFLEISDLLEH